MDKEGLENQIEETSKEQPKKRERTKIEKIIIDLVCGVAVGAGAILPGFSGGVLCVVLGMYPLIMELFSHPFRAFKKHWKIYMFIGIGWVIGFFAVSNVIKFMYARYEVFTLWTFVGMIFGNIPSLYKQAGKKGRKVSSFISMAVAFIVMFAILFSVAMLPELNITPNIWWYLFSGFMWGLSIIIPGLTSSSIMMSLGIYESFNAGLAEFNPIVIIPWVVGMILTAAALARLVEYIFKKHYSEAFHAVIGIVVSSTIMIFPIFYPYKLSDIFISAACVIIGFIVAYFLSSFKIEEQTEQETT
jgi:putative membrane protein